jgi:O-antigen ligase
LGDRSDPHNHVVAMIAETGIPGGVLYTAFFLAAIVVAVRAGRCSTRGGAMATASAAGLTAFAVVGFFLGLQTNALAFMYAGLAQLCAFSSEPLA